jgi:hypothetical protein
VTRLALAALAFGAALLQAGAMPALFFDPASTPLLPVALLAAWGAMRSLDDMWPGFFVVPLTLGVVSEERVGWFLLALLPTAALLMRPAPPEALRQLSRAGLVAAAGALAYLVLLFIAAGEVAALLNAVPRLAVAMLGTAAIAATFALLLWPARSRRARGLFD